MRAFLRESKGIYQETSVHIVQCIDNTAAVRHLRIIVGSKASRNSSVVAATAISTSRIETSTNKPIIISVRLHLP